jgi:hypothetical protein
MIDIFSGLQKLYPQVITLRGNIAYDANDNEVAYDKSAVQAKMIELQQAKEQEQQASEANKASALSKLSALGLTTEEIKAITG